MVAIYTPRDEEPACEPEPDDGSSSWVAASRWTTPDDSGVQRAPVVALERASVWSEPAPSPPWPAATAHVRHRHPAGTRPTRGNLAMAEPVQPAELAAPDGATAGGAWAAGAPPLRRPGGEVRRGPRPAPEAERAAAGRWPDRATRVRRRRLTVLVGLVVLVVGLVVGVRTLASLSAVPASPAPAPLDGRTPPVAGRTYVVQPGDTLWSIARQIAPDADPRPVVDALRRANGGPTIKVGQQLTIPSG